MCSIGAYNTRTYTVQYPNLRVKYIYLETLYAAIQCKEGTGYLKVWINICILVGSLIFSLRCNAIKYRSGT